MREPGPPWCCERLLLGKAESSALQPAPLQLTLGCPFLPGALVQATILRLASNPNISGPAFPAAWIEPGALPRLFEFDLSGCNITGILPEYLPWPHLKTLCVGGASAFRLVVVLQASLLLMQLGSGGQPLTLTERCDPLVRRCRKLAGTRVEGSMPDSWCKAPFAKSLSTL